MTRVETLIYEYNHCIDCDHCNLDRLKDYGWKCDLTDKTLWYTRLGGKIPQWCPLPTKEAGQRSRE